MSKLYRITKYAVVGFRNAYVCPVAVKEFIMRTCSVKIPSALSADDCVDNAILPSSKTCYCASDQCNYHPVNGLTSGSPLTRTALLSVATVTAGFVSVLIDCRLDC